MTCDARFVRVALRLTADVSDPPVVDTPPANVKMRYGAVCFRDGALNAEI